MMNYSVAQSGGEAVDKEFRFDVFLSHNSKDKPQVLEIARALNAAGLRVFYDDWCIEPGPPYDEQIDVGLERSAALLVFLGPNGWGPIHRDEARTSGALANRKERTLLLVHLPGAADLGTPTPSALRNRRMTEFTDMDPKSEAFKVAIWMCRWAATGKQVPEHFEYQRRGTSTQASAPVPSPAAPDARALPDFLQAWQAYGAVLILGRSWGPGEARDEAGCIARNLASRVLPNHSSWVEHPLRPPLDEIASCAREVEGDLTVWQLTQDALDSGSRSVWSGHEPVALRAFFRAYRQRQFSWRVGEPLLLISSSMGLGVERLLLEAELPFIRVVLQSQAANPRLVVRDCLSSGGAEEWREHLQRAPRRDDLGSIGQLGDLLPRGVDAPHAVLVKWMGSVDEPESCLLTRGHFARFAEQLGRGNSLGTALESALTSRAVLMAGLRVLDEDFALLRSLVLDRAFRKGSMRPRLWLSPEQPRPQLTLAQSIECARGEDLCLQLQQDLFRVRTLQTSLSDVLERLADLARERASR